MTSGLERHGSDLLRPVGPWTPAVHEYLMHLESVGFHGAPRVVGIEGDREVLTFVEGEVLADPEWEPGRGNPLPAYARTDDALAAVGHLLRDLHEASRSFQPQRTDYRFIPTRPTPARSCRTATWARGTPSIELVRGRLHRLGCSRADRPAARSHNRRLGVRAAGIRPSARRDRLRSAARPAPPTPGVVDAYGLTDRPTIIPALQQAKLKYVEQVQHWPIDAAGAAGSLEFLAGELRLLNSITPALRRAL